MIRAFTLASAPDPAARKQISDYKMEGLVWCRDTPERHGNAGSQTPESKTEKTAINITGTLSNDNYEIPCFWNVDRSSNLSSDGGSSSAVRAAVEAHPPGGSNGSGQ